MIGMRRILFCEFVGEKFRFNDFKFSGISALKNSFIETRIEVDSILVNGKDMDNFERFS
jgi:hypothetical protein